MLGSWIDKKPIGIEELIMNITPEQQFEIFKKNILETNIIISDISCVCILTILFLYLISHVNMIKNKILNRINILNREQRFGIILSVSSLLSIFIFFLIGFINYQCFNRIDYLHYTISKYDTLAFLIFNFFLFGSFVLIKKSKYYILFPVFIFTPYVVYYFYNYHEFLEIYDYIYWCNIFESSFHLLYNSITSLIIFILKYSTENLFFNFSLLIFSVGILFIMNFLTKLRSFINNGMTK